MTPLESIRDSIDSERALLLAIQKTVISPFLKRQCQNALNYVDDWEYFLFGGGLANPERHVDQALLFLQIATSQREAIDDTVRKYGFDAITLP